MYTLFGAQGSGSAAIEIALARCEVPYTLIPACSWEEGPGTEALKQANPLAQVPTLILPDGSVVTESVAILIHLGLVFPESGLLPKSPATQARKLRALVYMAANCYPAIGVIDYPERWIPDAEEPLRRRLVDGARQRLHRHWDVFSDLVVEPGFWQADAPGAVEVLASVLTRWGEARGHLQLSRPGFHAWLSRVDAHPTVSPIVRRHWPA